MSKKQIGWIINGILAAAAIITSFIIPNPLVILSVFTGATVLALTQSIFTVVETRGEKLERSGIRVNIASDNQNEKASRERENMRAKEYIRMASQENSESNPNPVKVYEDLHSNPQQAHFSGHHRTYPSGNNESNLNTSDVKQDEEMTL